MCDAGFFPPSSGTAIVNGFDIRHDIDKVRRSLGLCPQHNILFDDLTVQEHLIFFTKVFLIFLVFAAILCANILIIFIFIYIIYNTSSYISSAFCCFGKLNLYCFSGIYTCLTTATATWNSLPASVINCDNLSVFKSRLKTHIFNFAYS